jgi:hypothetical protein
MAVITTLGVPDNTGNTTTIMPKLQYRFRVTFIGEGFTSTPTRSVMSAGRPSLTHDPVTIDAYNSRIYLAGKHTWNEVTIMFRDDVDSAVLRELNGQLNRQVDHANQSSSRAGSAYKFQTLVETLDGGNPNPGVLDKYELAGCYISGIQYGDLNYATSDQITFNVTLRYDNCEIFDAAGNATLTGVAQNQTLSNATGGGSLPSA